MPTKNAAKTASETLIESIPYRPFNADLVGKTIKFVHPDYDGFFIAFTDGSYCKVSVDHDPYDGTLRTDTAARATVYELKHAGLITHAQMQAAEREDRKSIEALQRAAEEGYARALLKRVGAEKIREMLDNA